MCDVCGCEGAVHEHVHADGTRHSHGHGEQPHEHGEVVALEQRIVAKNDALAARNRAWLAARRVYAMNLMGTPGAGKTAILERTLKEMKLCVIEGDQATANDAERIRAAGGTVVQVNTGTGCHLDADMVLEALTELGPQPGAIVAIENVGNLVCPALFDLGEARRVVVFSVTEGEDKPLKYPHMFRAAQLVLLNKVDLLPHLDFDVERAISHAREVNPGVPVLGVSARTGEGLGAWYDWLRRIPSPR
jgi:hydrogenase nickel incorporation protein HypB